MIRTPVLAPLLVLVLAGPAAGQETRLLRQPTRSANQVAFAYAGDLWITGLEGGDARRLTSTPAVESEPHFSPDGRRIAFTSNRCGTPQVYVMDADGGEATRLTWYPAPSRARGWTPDGQRVLYASGRENAPTPYDRLWTVAANGGPSTRLPAPAAHDGCYSPDGRRLVVDRVSRWDVEFRGYRGGQNTPLTILDLATLEETQLPSERTQDTQPVWAAGRIWFLSDRNWATNVWSYDPASQRIAQVTRFTETDVKSLAGGPDGLVFEQDGAIHLLDPATGQAHRMAIRVRGDFPWAESRWVDVSDRVQRAALSATGKRVLFEARGEVFSVPVEKGDVRDLTRSPGADDRAATWSPDGRQVAWFSDAGEGYQLLVGTQDGLAPPRRIPIGESKMAWDPVWSPDGSRIAFMDDRARVRVVELAGGRVSTADDGGSQDTRGESGLCWSPDSKWLAYSKLQPNRFHRIVAWSLESGRATPLTDALADAVEPAWDRDGRHLWFLASTNLALASGWANTSTLTAKPVYGVYVLILRADEATPFPPKSDEEGGGARRPDSAAARVRVDFPGIDRRILALAMPARRYEGVWAGAAGTVFVAERPENATALTLHKYVLADAKADVFTSGVSQVAISADGKKLLWKSGPNWVVSGTDKAPEAGKGTLKPALSMWLDRREEWRQVFDEAWRYERDFFYDPNLHGNDWDAVRARYRPLVEHVRHRADLTYLLDQLGGELSVGHSFVSPPDEPAVDTSRVGLLGADLVADAGRWRIRRVYTFESWNPGLAAPLDRPGLRAPAGTYLLAVNGVPLTSADDPYRAFDGMAGRQTVLTLNDRPQADGAWTETVEPVASETPLRQRAWVEDNRRRVDELSHGALAYVWVPNTGGPGLASFDRYYFAQQDRAGAIIDERFNSGGLLDDYMVDLLARGMRAAVTDEGAGAAPMRLPQGVIGPKVLLVNELAGSGGDYLAWAFRQQRLGPLVGTRTWGGLVSAAVHYPFADGTRLTAPVHAVFDPARGVWVGENEGVPPDIEVPVDARSVAEGRDPQLERAVEEAMKLAGAKPRPDVVPPPYSRPSKRPGRAG